MIFTRAFPRDHVHIYKVRWTIKMTCLKCRERVGQSTWSEDQNSSNYQEKFAFNVFVALLWNFCPSPSLIKVCPGPHLPLSTTQTSVSFGNRLFPSSRYFSISPNLSFNILLPGSLSQLFIRYFIRDKCKKVIYIKGVYEWQWFNLFRWYSCFKRSFLEVVCLYPNNETHVVKWKSRRHGEWASSGPLVSFITTQTSANSISESGHL